MKKSFLFIVICFLIVGITFFEVVSHDKMNEKQIIYQGNHLMVSIDGESSSKFPTSGNYYLTRYDCSNKNTVVDWDRENYQIRVTNGNKKGGVSCHLTFESTPKLADMSVGSFVKYTGNNGCVGESCSGRNANYVDENSKGYCNNSNSSYYYHGFRIGYSANGTAYLVSAGSPECMCTGSNGELNANCSDSINSDALSNHLVNLDQVALKYCNSNYVYDGVCDVNTVRNINDNDFNYITNQGINLLSCFGSQNKKCGYTNDLIDIGSDYWYSNYYDNLSNTVLYWSSESRLIRNSKINFGYGIRPVIRMDENIVVVGGNGSYDDPYEIANNTFLMKDKDVDKNTMNLEMIGFGVDKMCINLNSTVCTNYIPFDPQYVLDISRLKEGKNIIYAYYKDSNDKIIATIDKSFYVDSEES